MPRTCSDSCASNYTALYCTTLHYTELHWSTLSSSNRTYSPVMLCLRQLFLWVQNDFVYLAMLAFSVLSFLGACLFVRGSYPVTNEVCMLSFKDRIPTLLHSTILHFTYLPTSDSQTLALTHISCVTYILNNYINWHFHISLQHPYTGIWQNSKSKILGCLRYCFGHRRFLMKHFATDWLVGTWLGR